MHSTIDTTAGRINNLSKGVNPTIGHPSLHSGSYALNARKSRLIIWGAVGLALSACLGIVVYHSVPDSSTSLDLSEYLERPALAGEGHSARHASDRGQPSTGTGPGSPSFSGAGTLPGANAPRANMVAKLDGLPPMIEIVDKRVTPPARVASDDFPFQELPYDAPVAEFPIVLVWQKQLELEPILEMDRSATPSEKDALLNMRQNIYRVPGPPPPGPPPPGPKPKPGEPPVESNAGL